MKIWKLFTVIGAMAALFLMASPATAADSLKIMGSTTVYPVAEAAVTTYKVGHPDARIDLSAGGSSVGVRAIIDGMADIGNSSRDITDKELDMAKKKGSAVQKHVVAYDCIVPIVHPSNPVANLTIQQLQDIYTGKVSNWKEVGGADEKIVVVSREDTSGTYETWQHFVLGKNFLAPKALKQQSNPGVRAYVAKTPKAIGY
ncbi:MAG: phosphate ABC transporter substrate-binding protein, partial [Pseudomonadota bacterium]